MNFKLVEAIDAENPNVWDLSIKNGTFETVRGIQLVKQKIRHRLQFHLGEWFLDRSLGFPWIDRVLVKNPNINAVRSAIATVIQNTTGVQSVDLTDFSFDRAARQLSVQYSATGVDGDLISTDNEGPLVLGL